MNKAISDEQRIAFFTRPGESRPFVMPDPENEDGGKNFFHDFPAKDQANKHALLVGNDETETIRLNNRAAILLSDIRAWVRATQYGAYSSGHNDAGADSEGEEFPFGTGYGIDMRHDYGPSALHYCKKTKTYRSGLKEQYEAGSPTKAKLGDPWIPGPVILKNAIAESGQEIKYMAQAGHVRLDFREGKNASTKEGWRWEDYRTTVTKPRGKNLEEPVSSAGLIAASTANVDGASDTESTNRNSASNYEAGSVWVVDQNEREYAHAKLDQLSELLTPKMYDALIAAALGDTFDEIGRRFMPGLSPNDKRPGTMGKAVVIDALELLILRKFRSAT